MFQGFNVGFCCVALAGADWLAESGLEATETQTKRTRNYFDGAPSGLGVCLVSTLEDKNHACILVTRSFCSNALPTSKVVQGLVFSMMVGGGSSNSTPWVGYWFLFCFLIFFSFQAKPFPACLVLSPPIDFYSICHEKTTTTSTTQHQQQPHQQNTTNTKHHRPTPLSPVTSPPLLQLGNLVFLSARPHVYKDVSESKSYAKFKRLQVLYCCML